MPLFCFVNIAMNHSNVYQVKDFGCYWNTWSRDGSIYVYILAAFFGGENCWQTLQIYIVLDIIILSYYIVYMAPLIYTVTRASYVYNKHIAYIN